MSNDDQRYTEGPIYWKVRMEYGAALPSMPIWPIAVCLACGKAMKRGPLFACSVKCAKKIGKPLRVPSGS